MTTHTTFESTIAGLTMSDAMRLAEQKKTFDPTLAALRELERQVTKHKSKWLPSIEVANQRRHQAATKGVIHTRLTHLLEELAGGRGDNPGLIAGTDNMVRVFIERIEKFSLKDLPQRSLWISWYGDPERIRDNIHAIEERIEWIEAIVADDGDLHRMVAAKAVQPAEQE